MEINSRIYYARKSGIITLRLYGQIDLLASLQLDVKMIIANYFNSIQYLFPVKPILPLLLYLILNTPVVIFLNFHSFLKLWFFKTILKRQVINNINEILLLINHKHKQFIKKLLLHKSWIMIPKTIFPTFYIAK